jgi:CRISPR-associated protein Csx17
MNTIRLAGCTAEPMADYLKCLGVFRIIGEQSDPQVQLSWHQGAGCLHTTHSGPEIVDFLLTRYRPTPILAPWNGGSGFYGASKAQEVVDAIAGSDGPRFDHYRQAIHAIREFLPREKPKDDEKQSLLAMCRARLADEIVPWLDVCFVLGEDSPRYFPLLGTGGNDGRLEFTSNFMQRLQEILGFHANEPPPENSRDLLRSALFRDVITQLDTSAIGQFDPGAIGGPNSTQGAFEGKSLVNAWDYVLMMEGCLLFAGGFSRRNGQTGGGRVVFPFSVDTVAVGYGSATLTEETSDGSRAEIWLPVWSRPFSLRETRHLLSEGRAQVGRRQARNSIEFAMAVNLLGVDRGVESFQRYGFLKRNGLAFLAAPLGEMRVQPRPTTRLLQDPKFMDWMDSWRRATSDKNRCPSRYLAALRGIDRACYEFMTRSELGNEAAALQAILRSIGRAERVLATGRRFTNENSLRPLQGLQEDWIRQANDDSCEFRLALALASVGRSQRDIPPLRAYIEPVEYKGAWASWNHDSCTAVWTEGALDVNLAKVFRRRQMEAFRAGDASGGVPLEASHCAPLRDVLRFLDGQTDDRKLLELLWGLLAVNTATPNWDCFGQESPPVQVPLSFGALRLLVQPLGLISGRSGWTLAEVGEKTRPESLPFHILASGRSAAVAEATTRAAQRLRQSGHIVVGYRARIRAARPLPGAQVPATRLLAAMLFPLSPSDLTSVATSVLFDTCLEN